MNLAAVKLAVAVGILVPLAWSALLEEARKLVRHDRRAVLATERAEGAMLLLMLAPLLAAACLVVVGTITPTTGVALSSVVHLTLAQPASPITPGAGRPADLVDIAALATALLYVAGALPLLLRLVRERLRLRWVIIGSVDAGATWGAGVRLSTESVPAFASGRTCIVLPAALVSALSPEQTALVIRHERAHLRRRDPRLFLMLALAEIACWCLPAVRHQIARCRLAAELACDAAAIRESTGLRLAYAEALVVALRYAAGHVRLGAAGLPTITQGDHHMRINEIMRPSGPRSRRPTRAPAVLGLLLAGPLFFLQADLVGAVMPRPAASNGLLHAASFTADSIDVANGGEMTLAGHVLVRQAGLDLHANRVVLTATNPAAAAARHYDRLAADGDVTARISAAGLKLLGNQASFTSDTVVRDGDVLILRGAKVTLVTGET